jgi:hypothetical protein
MPVQVEFPLHAAIAAPFEVYVPASWLAALHWRLSIWL